jgi:hypothetical protein
VKFINVGIERGLKSVNTSKDVLRKLN